MKQKRFAAALLALFLLIRPISASGAGIHNLTDQSLAYSTRALLYYLSTDGSRLVPKIRPVTVLPGEETGLALLRELGRDPGEEGLLSPYPQGASVRVSSFDLCLSIATVDLRGEFDGLDSREIFDLYVAVANTLCELGEIERVNILLNGRVYSSFGFGIPLGAMPRFNGDLQSLWQNYQNDNSPSGFSRDVTLYFLAENGQKLVPELRRIFFSSSQDYAKNLFAALAQGPKSAGLRPVLPRDLSLTEAPSFSFALESSERLLDLKLPAGALLQDESGELAAAAIALSLTGFVPALAGLRLSCGGREFSLGGESEIRRAQAEPYIGRQVTVYLPTGSGRLRPVTRAIGRSGSVPRAVALSLLEGPLPGESGLESPFPMGFSPEMLLGVGRLGDLMILNLSASGAQALSSLSMRQEQALCYALTNSLTELGPVKRLQFLCEGYTIEGLSGYMSLREPLLCAPGLILDS
ncbi:MAG: GerMN domain-containing protein [Christensenellaceae bacterium]|jgi:spore germination protein GerM|nr:GerMN domain-containing protein [Christensenellaceae bacterium]